MLWKLTELGVLLVGKNSFSGSICEAQPGGGAGEVAF